MPEPPKKAGEGGRDAVGDQRLAGLLVHARVARHGRDAAHVSDVLGDQHEHDREEHGEGGEGAGLGEVREGEGGEADPVGLLHAEKSSSPRKRREDVARDDAEEKIEMRPRNPRNTTAKRIVMASVNVAVTGALA